MLVGAVLYPKADYHTLYSILCANMEGSLEGNTLEIVRQYIIPKSQNLFLCPEMWLHVWLFMWHCKTILNTKLASYARISRKDTITSIFTSLLLSRSRAPWFKELWGREWSAVSGVDLCHDPAGNEPKHDRLLHCFQLWPHLWSQTLPLSFHQSVVSIFSTLQLNICK